MTMRAGNGDNPSNAVSVTITSDASMDRIWQALTDPTVMSQWFGSLNEALRPGGRPRLDFGDGDFFELQNVRLDPPHLVQYVWRFMGTGPADTITWHIRSEDDDQRVVTVTDYRSDRDPQEAQALEEGWRDFTRRLKGFLATGESTRYDWRRELDVSVDLPVPTVEAAWEALFTRSIDRWLPIDGDHDQGLADGALFVPNDGVEPSRLAVANVAWDPPKRVQFQLDHRDWRRPTSAELTLVPREGAAALLSVHHAGWDAIGGSADKQKHQRKRFSQAWITILERARQACEAAMRSPST